MNGNGAGSLRQVINSAIDALSLGGVPSTLTDFTVLSPQRDPYRLDTPAGHRDGAWFARMVELFLAPEETVHLRGMHYRLTAAGDVLMVNGMPYINTDECWNWLADTAAKAARWLGYVPFDRIVDERNASSELFISGGFSQPWVDLSPGDSAQIPESLADAMPRLIALGGFSDRQPYRIILLGEKTSLGPVLRPIAELVGGELLLPTGEASDTRVAELAMRCATDSRPAAVLYFSDFDPSGRQMAVSVARKLQALRDLLYPGLNIQLHPVALTLRQVRELELPSTPLKETERRADRWRLVMGHEQTEIDALAALKPEALEAIARQAIKPFYDPSLKRRVTLAWHEWSMEAKRRIEAHPAWAQAEIDIRAAFQDLTTAAETLHSAQASAAAALRGIESPPINQPLAQLDVSPPQALYTTADDFITASRRLIAHKRLEEDANDS